MKNFTQQLTLEIHRPKWHLKYGTKTYPCRLLSILFECHFNSNSNAILHRSQFVRDCRK